jgi:anti-sigma factor (TIGR02949 family)
VSCGKPHETPCSEVLKHLDDFLDGELAGPELAKFRRHVDECAPCLREYDLEEAVRRLVRRSCMEQAPATLRVSVTRLIYTMSHGSGGGPTPPA